MSTPVVVAIVAIIVVTVLCLVCGAIGITRLNRDASDYGLGVAPTPVRPTAPALPPHAPTPRTSHAKQGPVTWIPGDGTYLIAVDVRAGQYRAWVPETSILCYWERLSGTSGEFTDLIVNGEAGPGTPVIVTIAHSDQAFHSRGCGSWKPT